MLHSEASSLLHSCIFDENEFGCTRLGEFHLVERINFKIYIILGMGTEIIYLSLTCGVDMQCMCDVMYDIASNSLPDN